MRMFTIIMRVMYEKIRTEEARMLELKLVNQYFEPTEVLSQ